MKSKALPRIVKDSDAAIAAAVALTDDACRARLTQPNSMDDKPPRAKILMIDDDRELGGMVVDYLAADELDVDVRNSGEDGIEAFRAGSYDLLILDIMMPGISGLDVLRKIRQSSSVPVIMLTARGDDVDRIIGLEFGADDYLAKPFNPRELVARIKAILRRAQPRADESKLLELGDIRLDTRTHKASVSGTELKLTGTEFEILRCLLETPGEVVNKEHLSERALGRRLLPYDRSVDTHISNLRGKLERAGNRNETIQNQRGVGYLLIPGG